MAPRAAVRAQFAGEGASARSATAAEPAAAAGGGASRLALSGAGRHSRRVRFAAEVADSSSGEEGGSGAGPPGRVSDAAGSHSSAVSNVPSIPISPATATSMAPAVSPSRVNVLRLLRRHSDSQLDPRDLASLRLEPGTLLGGPPPRVLARERALYYTQRAPLHVTEYKAFLNQLQVGGWLSVVPCISCMRRRTRFLVEFSCHASLRALISPNFRT